MKKLFIHLGIHHTGTTFLQKKIFPFKEKFEKINSSMVDKKNYIEQVNEKLNFLYPNHF